MTITLHVETAKVMELEEYCEYVERNVVPSDRDSIVASAPALLALANNRHFIADRLNREIQQWRDFQSGNDYTAQTMLLARSLGLVVRANIWMPYDGNERHKRWQDRLYVYEVPHDHNFDFLTVGYYGPGYQTDLYEYDRASVVGLPDEPVELVPRGREQLVRGKVMMYRASRDVHAQYAPEAFSMSLNLLASDDSMAVKEQFLFDVERKRLRGPVDVGVSSRVFLCEVARYVGDERTSSLLDQIAGDHLCARTRAIALESLSHLEPGMAEQRWKRMVDDRDPYLRAIARRQLNG